MKIKEKIAQNNEYIALLPAGQFRDELISENEELYKKLNFLNKRKAQKELVKENKQEEIFINHKNRYFKVSEITEEMQEKETQFGIEIYKSKK